MTGRGSTSKSIFKDLRANLFFGGPVPSSDVDALRAELATVVDLERFTIWRRLRTLGVTPDSAEEAQVLGVIMELGIDGGTSLVFGLSDGSASVYRSNGAGNIGGQTRAHINTAARELVAVAAVFVRTLPLAEEHPLPAPGQARFSILTPAGVHVAEAQQDQLATGKHHLFPLFKAANEIMAGFRKGAPPETNDEETYVKCILTALAHGHTEAVLLTDAQPLPDPGTLTNDPKDLEWISRLAFALDRLSVKKVIAIVLRSAHFGFFHMGNSARFQARLPMPQGDREGESERVLEDVTFQVIRRKDRGSVQVEVRIPARVAVDPIGSGPEDPAAR
jgi:hypothetical protein